MSTTLAFSSGTTLRTGTPLTLSGSGQIIQASAGVPYTFGGVTDNVFTATKGFNVGSTLTINGTASQYVVINIPVGQSAKFGAAVVLTGGITDDHVLYNLVPGNTTEVHGGAGINNPLAVHGIIVGIDATFNMDNLVTEGHIYGGGNNQNFQLVSGNRNLLTPITITNTATLNPGALTASAGITISYNPSLPLTAAGTPAAQLAAGQYSLGGVIPGVYSVAVDGLQGTQAPAEQARIADAIASLNATFAPFGVVLVQAGSASAASATIHIDLAATTSLGGAAQGVLADMEAGGIINLASGWNWYTGSDPTQIGPGQYDFETIVMHELGHAFGLGESADPASVMYYQLAPGVVRNGLTAGDLSLLRQDDAGGQAGAIVTNPGATSIQETPSSIVVQAGVGGAADAGG